MPAGSYKMGPIDFAERQVRNRRASVLVVFFFLLFFLLLGLSIDVAYFGAFIGGGPSFPIATVVALILATAITLNSFFHGSEWILRSLGAQALDLELPEHREFRNIVTEMALASGSPMPRTYVIFDPAPNAFATGRNERTASICVTTGLLTLLDREETQGVIAHEFAHIRNQDILLMTLVSILVGGIALLCDWALRAFYVAHPRRRIIGKRALFLVLAMILIVIAPLISRLMAMAVSRQREYLADASAAEFTRNPVGLAKALEKIRDAAMPFHLATRGTAHLFFVNPLKRKVNEREGKTADLLSTHPPIMRRITVLYGMAGLRPPPPANSSSRRNLTARCPACNREMKQVSARANPGTLIVLDQCDRCGGIWCDKWELYPIRPDEAQRLEVLDQNRLRAPLGSVKKTLFCPRCRDRLQTFRDPLLPSDIQLNRCRTCDGIWLNRGQLSLFKRLQEKTRSRRLGKGRSSERAAATSSDLDRWVEIGTDGMYAHPGTTAAETENSLALNGSPKEILRTLMRTLLNV